MTAKKSKILCIGVGGCGGNIVDHMINTGLEGCEFHIVNTDAQALQNAKCPNTVQIGRETTNGLGSGGQPEIGRLSAEESTQDISDILTGADMVIIIAGMGGGTGAGASPVIARLAQNAGIAVICIAITPFAIETEKTMERAMEYLAILQGCCDICVEVSNQKYMETTTEELSFEEFFNNINNIIAGGVKNTCLHIHENNGVDIKALHPVIAKIKA